MAEQPDTQAQLLDARIEIERLRAKTTTTLTGTEFLTLLFVMPVILSFTVLGILICYKTLNNPAEVAPHLDIVLVAFALFSGPVTAFIAAMAQRLVAEGKNKTTED
jgi:hypothetical protein